MTDRFLGNVRHEPCAETQNLGQYSSIQWGGVDWSHLVTLSEPRFPRDTEIVLIELTGDDAGAPDRRFSSQISDETGLRTFTIFQLPNQPIRKMREDDLISDSFARFIATGDASEPLVPAMARAAQAVIDQLKERFGLHKYVITGASKRGWISWLMAAEQPEGLLAIVPRVFNHLSFEAQLDYQVESWGTTSPRIGDYAKRSLNELSRTDLGQVLIGMVDPIRFLERVTVPVLSINGSSDDYWCTDAATLYEGKLENADWITVPNASHHLNSRSQWLSTMGWWIDHLGEERTEIARQSWTVCSDSRQTHEGRWLPIDQHGAGWQTASFDEIQVEGDSWCPHPRFTTTPRFGA